MFGKSKIVIPEAGKSYKVLANGHEVVLKYQGRTPSNHCSTCACVSIPMWVLSPEAEEQIGAGLHDIQILKEVK